MKLLLKLLLSVISVSFLVVWFGVFNVSAKDKHWDITTKLFTFVKDRSIAARAHDIIVPDLSKPGMVERGAKNFDAMCAQCHLSPTQKSTELSLGLYPKAPTFHQKKHTKHSHSVANIFWTIKNGIKFTGMPAWSDSHTDQQIWEIIAFLDKFNGMSASEYTQLVGDGGHTHKETVHMDSPQVSSNDFPQEEEEAHQH